MNTVTANTKSKLKDPRCVDCFRRSYFRLFKKYKVSEILQTNFLKRFDEIIKDADKLSSPEIQQKLNKEFRDLIGIDDPFLEEKKESNIQASKICERWEPIVAKRKNSFNTSLRLAIAGNIMDYGAADNFDIDSVIEKVLDADFAIDHSCLLKKRIKDAKNILYLGDNAGEIVFDRLFIKSNMPNQVTYVVKGGPVLNDVTLRDADEVAMTRYAKVITNGYDAPSTILEKCSSEFIEHYNKADLIISKGQGNLEGLINEKDPRIFFVLMVKCDVIAELLEVEKQSFVVYNGGIDIEK